MEFAILVILGSPQAIAAWALASALLLVRVAPEDRVLRQKLPGSGDCAARVLRRDVPGNW